MDIDLDDQNFINEERKAIINISDKDTSKIPSDNSSDRTEQMEIQTCRICFRGNSSANLLTPCLCKGTIAYVHKHCLEKWLVTKNSESCDVCEYQFVVKKTPKSWWGWITDTSTKTQRTVLLCYVIWSIISTPFIVLLVKQCVGKVMKYSVMSGQFWGAVSLSAAALFGMVIQVLWIGIVIRAIYQDILDWKGKNYYIDVICSTNKDDDANCTCIQLHTTSSEKLKEDKDKQNLPESEVDLFEISASTPTCSKLL